jgi:hypothetical protein
LEQAIGKSYALVIANSNFDFSTGSSPGKADALSAYRIVVTSSATLTANRTITFPTNPKPYLIKNNTTGGFSILVKALSGTISTTIEFGESAYVYCDGTELVKIGSVIAAGASDPIFGDGSDGDVALSASATPWSRDMYFNRVEVTGTSTAIRTANFRIFGKYLTIAATCSVHNNGNDASVTTGGAALATGSVGGTPVAGPNGGTAAGTVGNSVTGSGIGTPGASAANGGGAGGNGSGGSGGSAGQFTPITAVRGNLRNIRYAVDGRVPDTTSLINVNTGASGGSGGGDGTAGGGGGAPGGYVMLCFRTIVNAGTISANGGNGGSPSAGNRGSGGGGQGGIVVLIYQYYSGAGTITVTGGSPGVKTGTGTNGTAGQSGAIYQFAIK